MGSDTGSTWVGKKPLRRIGGMSDALSIAADLGFSVAPPPSQVPTSSIAHTFFLMNYSHSSSAYPYLLRFFKKY